MLISLYIAILFYVKSIGRKIFKLLKYEVESLDQKILFLFGQEYHPPWFLLLQHRNAQQSEHQVPLEIQKMIN